MVAPPGSARVAAIRQRPRDYKDGKLAELWRGPRKRRAKVGFQNPSPSATPSALAPVAVQLRTVGRRWAIPA